MKMIFKSVLAAAAMAGAAAMVPGTASAAAVGVSIGVAVPVPVIVVGSPYGPGYMAYDEQYYYDPIYISGAWYHGPYRWRMHHGTRQFLVNGHWRRNEWRDNSFPTTIVFRNGGRYGAGRYDGFDGADRINARFHENRADRREDRQEDRQQDRHDDNGHHDKDNGSHN